jgi:hypothetical protein
MSRTSRKPSNLSQSLHERLNSYALAASAAGVGVLALAQPSEAKVIYHSAHQVVESGQHYHLDLNHDGIADFVIVNFPINRNSYYSFRSLRAWPATHANAIAAGQDGESLYALALIEGMTIGFDRSEFFYGQGVNMASVDAPPCSLGCERGNWVDVQDHYLGLAFTIRGKLHYGWARLNVSVGRRPLRINTKLTGYAYETIPNKPIITGKTKGPDVITLERGSLGALAAGATGLQSVAR